MLGCPEAGWEAGVVPVGSVLQRATASDEEGDRTGIRTVGGVAGAILHVGGVQNAGGIMVGTLGNRRGWVVSGPEGRRPTEADGEVDVVVDGDAAGKEAGSLVAGPPVALLVMTGSDCPRGVAGGLRILRGVAG